MSIITDAIIKEIIEKLESMKYGYLEIIVHNSKIVQINKTEKTRFDEVWGFENGGGKKRYK